MFEKHTPKIKGYISNARSASKFEVGFEYKNLEGQNLTSKLEVLLMFENHTPKMKGYILNARSASKFEVGFEYKSFEG
jgi:hypothetical protein